jgi:hypothetical protein
LFVHWADVRAESYKLTPSPMRGRCVQLHNMRDKGKIKELNQRIDEVLYYLWDPIGVSDEPSARAEYSSYTMTILKHVLIEDLNQIANQLSKIETDSMGLTSDKDRKLKVAQRFLDYKYAVEERLK